MCVPEYVSSSGREFVELAAMAGLVLDPWQAFVLERSLGERPDGKWAAATVGLCVPRQNGKGAILEARELGGLFLLGERLIIHSAHQFDTSLEAFARLLFLIENTDDLRRRVKRVSRSHGEEGIELTGGQRIRFKTRTKTGARGFSGDCVIFDEAMILPEKMLGAMLPTLSARPNPQAWLTGSAVDQLVHEDGVAFARVRERGHKGESGSLAFFEWSVDARDEDGAALSPDHIEKTLDGSMLARANPGLGVRLSVDWIVENEWDLLSSRTFAVERLGIGDWPATDGTADLVIGLDQWDGLIDLQSQPRDPVCFAFDVTPDRSGASISVAGRRPDGLMHVEVVDRRRGTGWVPGRLAELCDRHETAAVVCDVSGPAASLLTALADLGIEPLTVTAQEQGRACGMLYDLVEQAGLRHLGTAEMRAALRGAAKRPLGDAWAWSRRSSSVDISPLVSSTLALWGSATAEAAGPPAYMGFAFV